MATVNIDCLLPTKVLVRRRCSSEQSVRELKEALWKTAEFVSLKAPDNYTIVFVNQKAEQQRCTDESQRICDLQMFTPLLKIEDKIEGPEATELAKGISRLIGVRAKDCRDQGAAIGQELNEYWTKMAARCQKVIEERNNFSWDERVHYAAPPDLEGLGTCTPAGLKDYKEFSVSVWVSVSDQPPQKFQVAALSTDTAAGLIGKVLHCCPCTGDKELLGDDFVLKVRFKWFSVYIKKAMYYFSQ